MAVGLRDEKLNGHREVMVRTPGAVRSFIRTVEGPQTFRAVIVQLDRWIISRRCSSQKHPGGYWEDIATAPSAEAAEEFMPARASSAR